MRHNRAPLFLVAVAALALWPAVACAERPPERKEDAALVVTGRVGKVYTNVDAVEENYIIEIQVEAVERGRGARAGETVDARIFRRRPDAPRVPAAYGHHDFPREGERVRAYLNRRPDGQFEGTYPDWIDRLSGGSPGGPGAPPPGRGRVLGVFTRPVALPGRAGLQITQVTPGSPAQRAGLEPGDIILEANGQPTRTPDELLRAIHEADGSLRLTIRDVRSGRLLTAEATLESH
ncbi:MAG: PDZ domain-containing protein [Isosphaeraceae bacterium]|nr:PDZ domain-containing protein [Isosphaeraceae bacterium]